jgi:hypothetical protein
MAGLTKTQVGRVCNVVRERLGLGALCVEIDFPACACEEDADRFAATFIYYSGWRCRMEYLPHFFAQTRQRQLEIIVHEHLHLLMHPIEQVLLRCRDEWCKPSKLSELETSAHLASETAVDHATGPVYRLLEPHIQKALRKGSK